MERSDFKIFGIQTSFAYDININISCIWMALNAIDIHCHLHLYLFIIPYIEAQQNIRIKYWIFTHHTCDPTRIHIYWITFCRTMEQRFNHETISNYSSFCHVQCVVHVCNIGQRPLFNHFTSNCEQWTKWLTRKVSELFCNWVLSSEMHHIGLIFLAIPFIVFIFSREFISWHFATALCAVTWIVASCHEKRK